MADRIEMLPSDLQLWSRRASEDAQDWRTQAGHVAAATPGADTYGWYGRSVAASFGEVLREVQATLDDQATRWNEVGGALRETAHAFEMVELAVAADFDARLP